ncbi:MAG: hypothetical protein OEV94_11465, partial [Deltaproteobacteria bacterium]|nr:hypothetical protein [Deltaproteobacteria bacterium]
MNQLTNLLLGLAVLALAGCEGTGGGGVGGVVCGSFVSEGTSGPGGPMALIQDTTHAGLVGCVGDSFYQVNFHTAGTHTITVNSMSADVDPQTYTDNMFMMVTGT